MVDRAVVAAPAAPASDLTGRLRAAFLRSEALRGYALLSPTLVVMAVTMCAPFALMIAYSFWTQDYLTIDTSLTLANYEQSLERPIYRALLLRSLAVSGVVTALTVLLAYPMAYFVAFHVYRNKLAWIIFMTLPFWSSYLLRVFAWKVILGYEGMINQTLVNFGLIEQPLAFILYNPTAVVITLAHAWAAFAILPIYVSLEKIDRSLLEAATDLGDGPVARFLRVTVPLSMPGVTVASLMIFIPTVADYITPTLVGGPDGLMIANLIQTQFGRANNWPLGAALAVIAMIVLTLIAMLYVWLARKATERIA